MLLYDFMVGGMAHLTEEMVDSLWYLCICAGAREERIIFCSNDKFKKLQQKTLQNPGSAYVTSIICNKVRDIVL